MYISTQKCQMIFFLKCMSRITDSILMTHEDLAFVGDMNCCPSKSDTIKTFCDLYDLSNLINEPTCFKGSTPSILDVILVTNPRRYISTLNARCYVSDFHNIIGAATKNSLLKKIRELYTIEVTRILSNQTSVATLNMPHFM